MQPPPTLNRPKRDHLSINITPSPIPSPPFPSPSFSLPSLPLSLPRIIQPPSSSYFRNTLTNMPRSLSTSLASASAASPAGRAHQRLPSIAAGGGRREEGGGGAQGQGGGWRGLFASTPAAALFGGETGGKERLRSSNTGVEAALRKGAKAFAALWVTEGDRPTTTSTSSSAGALAPNDPAAARLHGDSDLPSSSAPPSSSSPSSSTKRLLGLPLPLPLPLPALLLVLALFLLGLRELLSPSSSSSALSSSSSSSPPPRLTFKDVARRNPFEVLRLLAPLTGVRERSGAKKGKKGKGGKEGGERARYETRLPGYDKLWRGAGLENSIGGEGVLGGGGAGVGGDTTAVVLHWKRTDNVVVILAHLCQYGGRGGMFEKVVVWNNNPEVVLTRETFAASHCPPSLLQIYNSPTNLLFLSRYLACSSLSSPQTPYCYFQDDDWVVGPLRAMYSQFKREPEGPVVVNTNGEVGALYGLEWCFFNAPLHTCFHWLGTGAFLSRLHVERFLATVSYLGYSRAELAHADNSFSTFLNRPPVVVESRLRQLPDKGGHSEGEGIRRNKEFIQQGLSHLSAFLGASFPAPLAPFNATPFPPPLLSDQSTSLYRATPAPPSLPHPHAHHARSACFSSSSLSTVDAEKGAGLADPQCLFHTNLPLLPSPSLIPYPGVSALPPGADGLTAWEEHLGYVARGWREHRGEEGVGGKGETWGVEEEWRGGWGYEGASDGDVRTAFRSADVAREQDYIALSLLSPLSPSWTPRVSLSIILEDATTVLSASTVEVSRDGYHWFPPRLSLSHHFPTFHCTLTPHPSTRPSLPFPNSRLLSLAGRRVLKAAVLRAEAAGKKGGEGQEGKGGWWGWLRGEGERLKECTVELSSRMPSLAGVSTSSDDDGAGGGGGGGKGGGGGGTKWTRAPPTAGGSSSADGLGDEDYDATSIGSSEEGWKFVRIVVKGDGSGRERQLEVGWGVYEMWMEVGEEEGQGEDGKGGR